MRHRPLLICSNDIPVDNRLTAKPHFAAPPAPKPAPTVLQTIHTGASAASSSAGAAIATRRARASLGPSVPRMQRPRGSSIGLNNNVAGFQRFALTGGRRLTETIDERSSMADFGMRGMTEKDIEDKVGSSCPKFPLSSLLFCPRNHHGRSGFLLLDSSISENFSWFASVLAKSLLGTLSLRGSGLLA